MLPSQLLSDPSKWTTEAYARTAMGNSVFASDDRAVCWCIFGAIDKCLNEKDRNKAVDKVNSIIPNEDLITFNDDPKTTFQDIRNLLLKAGL